MSEIFLNGRKTIDSQSIASWAAFKIVAASLAARGAFKIVAATLEAKS